MTEILEQQLQEQPTARRASSALDWEIPEPKLISFDKVRQHVQRLDDLRFNEDNVEKVTAKGRGVAADTDPGYNCMNLNRIVFTSAGTMQVPGFGLLRATDHAKTQIGNLVGVRWERFFGEQDPAKINKALQDHLNSRTDDVVVKIIARQHLKKEPSSDGLLRGVVSPSYSEIRDAVILERLAVNPAMRPRDMGFSSTQLRDSGSYYSLVYKEPIDLTGHNLGPTSFTGRTGPHGAPSKDVGYFGVKMRNSEVGTHSWTADAYVMRLVCVNGAMMIVDGKRLMQRIHRGLTTEKIDGLINDMFRDLPRIKEAIVAKHLVLKQIRIDNIEDAIRNVLAVHKQPVVIQDAAVTAYKQEPEPTAYGVYQAITATARAMRFAPDRSHDLELIAGAYADKMKAA